MKKNWGNQRLVRLGSAICDADSWRVSLVLPVGLEAIPRPHKTSNLAFLLETLSSFESDNTTTSVTSLVVAVHLSFSVGGRPFKELRVLDDDSYAEPYVDDNAAVKSSASVTCTSATYCDSFNVNRHALRDRVFELPIPDRGLPLTIRAKIITTNTTHRRFSLVD